jgi:hypothetical protein
LFELLADMPNYGRWLPGSQQFGRTTDVEPYPVQLGSRYHDGKPDEPGKDWWGTVTGFQPPGSLDFHHTIAVTQLRATVDVHIHYSFELENASTRASRWLVLDISMPAVTAPSADSSSSASTRKTCGPWQQSKNTPRHTPVILTTTEQSRTGKSVAAPAITLAASAHGSPTIPPGTQKRIPARGYPRR